MPDSSETSSISLLGKVGLAIGAGALGGCCIAGARYLDRVGRARRRLHDLIAQVAGKDARVVITGATSGIGAELTHQFARHPSVSLLLGCRNTAQGKLFLGREGAAQDTGVKVVPLDLLDLDSVQSFADEAHAFLAGGDEGLRLVINNAGVMEPKKGRTAWDLDPTWQTNFLGPFLLTELLSGHRATAHTKRTLRMIHVSSRLERRSQLDEELLNSVQHGQPGFHTYADSKRALMLWTSVRAQTFAFKSNMYVHATTPGMVDTQLGRHMVHPWIWPFTKPIRMLLLKSPAEGALSAIACGLGPRATQCFGRYYDGEVQLEDLVMERMGEKKFAVKVVQWAKEVTALDPRAAGYDR